MLSDNVDDLRVVEDVNILPKITSIVENTLVDFRAPLLMGFTCLLILPVMTWIR